MHALRWASTAALALLGTGGRAAAAQLEPRQWHRQWWRGIQTGNLSLTRDHYNASDVVSIVSQDLSQPYPGRDPAGSRWTLEVRVAGLIPVDAGTVAGRAQVALVFRPDAFAGDALDDRWSVCAWTFPAAMDDREAVETLRAQDPARQCAGVLDSGCLGSLHGSGAAAAGNGCAGILNGDWTSRCRGLTSPIPPPSGSDSLLRSVREGVRSDNGSYHVLGAWGVQDKVAEEEKARNGYDRIMTDVYPVLLVVHWHDRDGDTGGNRTWSWMRCLRAMNVQEGSKAPESLGDRRSPNRGSVLRVPGSGVSAVMIAVAMAFL